MFTRGNEMGTSMPSTSYATQQPAKIRGMRCSAHAQHANFRPCQIKQFQAFKGAKCDQGSGPKRRRFTVYAGPRQDVTESWWEKNCPENVTAVNNIQEFVDALADSGDNMVIVDFYAKWCHACRSLFPKLCQICRDNPDLRLLKIDWDENKDIAHRLGVKVLPYFIVFRGAEGKVAEFSCSVAKVQRMRDAIIAHNSARCSLGLNPAVKEYFPTYKPTHEMDRHEITILSPSGDHVVSRSIDMEADDEKKTQKPEPAVA